MSRASVAEPQRKDRDKVHVLERAHRLLRLRPKYFSKQWTDSLIAGVVNAIFIFVTFLLSLPALFLPMNRGWLRAQGWLVVVCATFTLGLGIAVWVDTLQTRAELGEIWQRESPLIQSLLQQKVRTIKSDSRQYQCMTTTRMLCRAYIPSPSIQSGCYAKDGADTNLVQLLRLL